MNFYRIKWLTVLAVVTFMLAFEYVRHFVWLALLHTWVHYILSVAIVVVATLVFNQIVFGVLERLQQNLSRQNRRLSTLKAIAVTVSQSLELEAPDYPTERLAPVILGDSLQTLTSNK
jgi:hypothetical protein